MESPEPSAERAGPSGKHPWRALSGRGVSSNRRRTTLGFRPGAAELGGARVQATRLGTGRLPGTAWHLCGVRPRLPGSGTVPKPAHVLERLQKIASVRARGPSSLPTCSCSDPRRHVQCQRVPRDATAPDRRACRHLDLAGFPCMFEATALSWCAGRKPCGGPSPGGPEQKASLT